MFGAIINISCSFTVVDDPSLILQASFTEPSISFYSSFLKGNQTTQTHQNKQQTMVFCMDKTKYNLNKQLRKAAGLIHRRVTPELESKLETVQYSIPPLEFSQVNLSVDTTELSQGEADSSTASTSISNSESTLMTVSTNPSSLHQPENGVVDQPFVSQTTTTMDGKGK